MGDQGEKRTTAIVEICLCGHARKFHRNGKQCSECDVCGIFKQKCQCGHSSLDHCWGKCLDCDCATFTAE